MWKALAISCLLAVAAQDSASSSGASSGNLNLGPVNFAGYRNYVLRDNTTAAQVVISNEAEAQPGAPARFITAFPRANTGALVYFVPENNATLHATLDQSSLKSIMAADDQRGISGSVTVDQDFNFGVTLLGSVRTLRDYVESGGKVFHEIFNYTLGETSNSSVQLVRHWINGSTVQYFTFETGNNAGLAVTKLQDSAPGIRFWRLDNLSPLTINFKSHFNWTGTTPETPFVELQGLGADSLFLKADSSGESTATVAGGRPMAVSTAEITATSWPTGLTATNPMFTMHENQTRVPPQDQNLTVAPNTTVPNPPPSSEQTSAAAEGNSSSGDTASKPPPQVGETTNSAAANVAKVLAAIHGPGSGIADQMSFLTYASEFLAGGWRFLTYFGRDTLIAARLLLPVLSPEATEAVLAAAIERTNGTSGELCHEETVGDYASWINLQDGHPELGNKPVYAYTMVDTDFLLLPLIAKYAATSDGSSRISAFMARNSTLVPGTFQQLVETNAGHVVQLARAFAKNPARHNLVAVRSYPVGNWRDSNFGLGNGTYPFDVNVALVPAALRAAAQLAEAGAIGAQFKEAAAMAGVWEDRALDYFHVHISHKKAERQLERYVKAANLSDALLYGAGSLNGTQTADGYNAPGWAIGVPSSDAKGDTHHQVPSPQVPDSERDTYYALSLKPEGPVHIQNSDLGFLLLYGDSVAASAIKATIQALQPYPRGLLTNVGLLVANPAYSWERGDVEAFSNRRYHGAVTWSFQQGLMAAGIARQLALCGSQDVALEQVTLSSDGTSGSKQPKWCSDSELVTALHAAQGRLWDSISGAKDELYTEVWSPVFESTTGTFSVGDLGKLSPEGTEGDAIQLWSYGFLAQIDPRTGTPVAEWAPSAGNTTSGGPVGGGDSAGGQGGQSEAPASSAAAEGTGSAGGVTNTTATSEAGAAPSPTSEGGAGAGAGASAGGGSGAMSEAAAPSPTGNAGGSVSTTNDGGAGAGVDSSAMAEPSGTESAGGGAESGAAMSSAESGAGMPSAEAGSSAMSGEAGGSGTDAASPTAAATPSADAAPSADAGSAGAAPSAEAGSATGAAPSADASAMPSAEGGAAPSADAASSAAPEAAATSDAPAAASSSA